MPACFAVASMMRMLAWWGISRSMAPASRPARCSARSQASAIERTAALKTSRRATAGPVQQLRQRAVGLQIARKNAPPIRALPHDRCARAIAEQDGRGPVAPVHDAGQLLRGDHEHVLGLLGCDDAFSG